MTDSKITPPARQRMAHTLKEQLEQIKALELLIAKRRIDESCKRIFDEANELFDIQHDAHDGGQ